jgi:hypothetical protein
MKTLADLKRVVAEPNVKLTLIKCIDPKTESDKAHRYLNATRAVKKIQTNGFYLADPDNPKKSGSWIDYGKATQWAFTDTTATYADDFIILVYRVDR